MFAFGQAKKAAQRKDSLLVTALQPNTSKKELHKSMVQIER
jgi:hypothetical protein